MFILKLTLKEFFDIYYKCTNFIMTYKMLFDNDRKEETRWIRIAIRRKMAVLSDSIFWTVSTASPISCFNKEGQNIFLSKGVRKRYKKGKNGIFGPNSICFVNKKSYGMDEGGI